MKIFLFFLLFPVLVFSQDTISKSQLCIISLDKVKVVYRGVDNPITVAVANAKEYWVSGPGVSKTDELGKYIVRPGSGNELKIVVKIKFEDNSFVYEEHFYQIKGLPMPTGTLNNEYSSNGDALLFTLDELKDAKIGVELIDFLFKLNLEVTQYTITIPRYENLVIEGNLITSEAFNLLKKARKKDYIIISHMRGNYMGTHQTPKIITPIVFKITKK